MRISCLALLLVACGGTDYKSGFTPAIPVFASPIDGRRLNVGLLTLLPSVVANAPARERLVIRDAETWAAVWNRISENVQGFSPAPPVAPPPFVAFDQEMVLFVAMGSTSDVGASIRLDKVFSTPEGALVAAVIEHSFKLCISQGGEVEPIDAVAVPRAAVVTFAEEHQVQSCK